MSIIDLYWKETAYAVANVAAVYAATLKDPVSYQTAFEAFTVDEYTPEEGKRVDQLLGAAGAVCGANQLFPVGCGDEKHKLLFVLRVTALSIAGVAGEVFDDEPTALAKAAMQNV
jgi:hypothetical protein